MTLLQRIVDRLTGSRRTLPQLTLILIAGAAVYANSFRVGFVMDDYAVISSYGPRGVVDILLHGGPRRVADATFALNYALHGQEVAGYHAVNLLIHLAAAVTLYYLAAASLAALRQSFSLHGEESAGERLVPFAAVLLFAVHPLQTQAVTYIVQRYTCLATLLYLLAAFLFIRTRLAFDRGGLSPRTLAAAGGTVAAGVLALGSKQIAATLPLMLLMLEVLIFRGRLLGRRFFILCGTALLLAAAALLFAWRALSPAEMLTALNNATSEHHNLSRSGYFFTQLRVVGTYLRLLVLPYGQSIFHDYPFSRSFLSLPVVAAAALHLSLLGCCAALIRSSGRRLRDGDAANGPLLRLAGAGFAWFYVALIIESSFFPITDWIFEHQIGRAHV